RRSPEARSAGRTLRRWTRPGRSSRSSGERSRQLRTRQCSPSRSVALNPATIRAEKRSMSLRLGSLLPRVFVLVIVALLATATITFAAETRSIPATNPPAEAAAPKVLLVPDVRGQAYVFAKSTLEEGGFAWRVTGGAKGY